MQSTTAVVGFVSAFIGGIVLMWGLDQRSLNASAEPKPADSAAIAATLSPGPERASTPKEGAVPVELFVMSQCPYGVEAENGFKDVVASFGDDIDFRLEFIGDGNEKNLSSMHGENEVMGDLVQICAMKYSEKWFDMVLCQNKNPRAVHLNWQTCAEEIGLKADDIENCAKGEGRKLLAASFKRADERHATGSPTIFIGGKPYEGGRWTHDYQRAICAEFKGKKPELCSNIPEPPAVNVTILTDSRCADCNAEMLATKLKQFVAKPVITTVDYAKDEAGKKLFGEIKPIGLPALVFDETLDADKSASQQLGRGMKDVNGHKVLDIGGDWAPQCSDTDGCKLEECKAKLVCRTEIPKRLDLFVMSQCPYGVQAMDGMREVLDNFKKFHEKIEFELHFIGNGTAKAGFQSLHGQPEVDEDIRQACAQKHYGKDFKFMEYIWCKNKNWQGADWESCTGSSTGVEKSVLTSCTEGDEGKKLLEASFAEANAAQIQGSPSWMVNNKYPFSGVDPETIKSNFCRYNKVAGCDIRLSGPPQQQGGAAKPQPGCGG